jgi:hypothetical protein
VREDGKYSHFFRLNGEEVRARKRDKFFKHYKEEKKWQKKGKEFYA